jgi:hypothetical protein
VSKKKAQRTDDLLVDAKYEGQYVAFDPTTGREVIAAGKNAGTVVAKARKLGVQVPAIVFVPRRDDTLIY